MPTRLEVDLAETIVAAILAVATVEPKGTSTKFIIRRYAQTLAELRDAGGFLNPSTD